VSSAAYGTGTAGQAVGRARTSGLMPAAAVLLAAGTALLGAAVDLLTGPGLGTTFAVLFVAGCVLAALLVRRDGLRTVVVAPPLLYALLALLSGVTQSDGSPRTPVRQTLALFTELIIGAPALITATLAVVVIAVARHAPRR
jgi:hypothetical protein